MAAIFICLYGYPFSGIVFTRRCRRFFARLFLHVSVWLRSSS
ncbi:hypothetical protein SeW_A3057 [Salmonella enterica subsp. enterica serovar Weltevreden str. HI_N05-537]|nr:hypothetical protein SeW_A3057 [Salmonella enterica subsp. enterica serovar Weltevreden str. HI_N05-537]